MEAKIKLLKSKALQIRKLIIQMLAKAGSGHPGGSLSATDIITCLYFEVMNHDPKNTKLPTRDRFHLSKGHCCPALYAALAIAGYFSVEELMNLRKLNSILQGHPDRRTPGVEVSSGSLGQGLSVALGMAFAARIDRLSYRVYCLLGDGEIQEGNVWEAAMAAAHYKVDNLCAIVDNNHFQIDGRTDQIMNLEPLAEKWEAFGWNVIKCDGHDFIQLIAAFNQAKTTKFKPTVIIANTIKGKGISFMEGVVDFHGRAPTEEEKERALKELENIGKELL
ncbi:MAG: transketolase [Candidatus Omnitrophica bacterium]|nr:transketolase [Candidatus Omnitrophota bacterium]